MSSVTLFASIAFLRDSWTARERSCNLTQGKRSVDEFSREFNRLARYAPEEVSADSKKQERFRKGLNSGIRRELNLHDFATFQILVNKAIKAEDMITPMISASTPEMIVHPFQALR